MEYFDLYCYGATDSASFFSKPIKSGEKVWLDGIDGFFDQYFDHPPDLIRFVAVDNPLALPSSQDEFEALHFLEARVLTSQSIGGEVQIIRALALGQWARTIQLPTETRWRDMLLEHHLSQEVFERLLSQVEKDKWAIWTTTARRWKSLSETSAILIFKTDIDTRCIVLKTNAVPAFLFKISM